jgi:hypothetical protein
VTSHQVERLLNRSKSWVSANAKRLGARRLWPSRLLDFDPATVARVARELQSEATIATTEDVAEVSRNCTSFLDELRARLHAATEIRIPARVRLPDTCRHSTRPSADPSNCSQCLRVRVVRARRPSTTTNHMTTTTTNGM